MSQTRERYFELTLLGLILVLGYLLFEQAQPFMNGALGAATLYLLLRRVNIFLCAKVSDKWAPWIIVSAVMVFVLIPLSALVWYVIDLVQKVDIDVQVIIKRIYDTIRYVENVTNLQLVSEKSLSFLTSRVTAIFNMLMGGVNNFAINLFTALLLLFFMLAGGMKMERAIARCLPFNEANKQTITTSLTKIVRSNAIGIPLLAIIQGGVATLGYILCGVQNPIEFGALTGFASMIPLVGTMLVWIPLTVVMYFEQGVMPAIYVASYGILIISQCDNVLRMIMQKRMANTHPLVTIFGVIAGIPLFGFMGLIFGPLLVAMFLLFLDLFIKQYIVGFERTSDKIEDVSKGRKQAKDYKSKSDNNKTAQAAKAAKAAKEEYAKAKEERRSRREHTLVAKQDEAKSGERSERKSDLVESAALKATAVSASTTVSATATEPNAKSAPLVDSKNDSNRERKSRRDFKSAKAESKQQKRLSAKLRQQQEQQEQSFERPALDLSEPKLNADVGDHEFKQTKISQAIQDAFKGFEEYDDLDSNSQLLNKQLPDEVLKADSDAARGASKDSRRERRSRDHNRGRERRLVSNEGSERKDHLEHSDSSERNKRSERYDRSKHSERYEHSKNIERYEHSKHSERYDRSKHSERYEHSKHSERYDRSKHSERYEHSKHSERTERRMHSDHNECNEHAENKERRTGEDRRTARQSQKSERATRGRSSREERRSLSRDERRNSSSRRRDSHLDYQVMRPERHSAEEITPFLRTVVSHQFGGSVEPRRSHLKTQLVSMHTAKGTMIAQPTMRRRPSKRRPYHH